MTNVCNYVDDTSFHARDSDIGNVINRLEHDSMLAIEWFESNYLKLNEDKCHFLLSGYKHEMMFAKIVRWETSTNILNLKNLQGYINVNDVDIICLSEAFLDSSIPIDDNRLSIPDYLVMRADHPSNIKRGGVCL